MDDLFEQYRERVRAELPPDMLRLQSGYHQAADRIRNSALKVELTDYFVRHWMAKLGPHGTLLVVAFRTLGLPSLHRSEATSTVIISRAELVKITGLSLSTVKRTLQDPVFQEFVKPHERFAADPVTGMRRQVESEYEVFYDDPLVPGDEETLYREMIDRETRHRIAQALGLPEEEGPGEPEPEVLTEPQPGVPEEPQGQAPTEPGADEIRRLLESRFLCPDPGQATGQRGGAGAERAGKGAPVLAPPSPQNVLERYKNENVKNVSSALRPGPPAANDAPRSEASRSDGLRSDGLRSDARQPQQAGIAIEDLLDAASKAGPGKHPHSEPRVRDNRVDAYGWADRFIQLTGDKRSERFYIGAAWAYLDWDRARGWALLDEIHGILKMALRDGKLDNPGAAANHILRRVALDHGFAATRADRERAR